MLTCPKPRSARLCSCKSAPRIPRATGFSFVGSRLIYRRESEPRRLPPLTLLRKGCTMPRLVRTSPKYRLHKGSNQAVVQFAGQRIYLGVYGSDKSYRKYRGALKQWRELRQQENPELEQPKGSRDCPKRKRTSATRRSTSSWQRICIRGCIEQQSGL